MHPDELRYQVQGKPEQILIRSMDYLYPEALEDERLGALHYTGLIDSWSNLYKRTSSIPTSTTVSTASRGSMPAWIPLTPAQSG